MDYFANVTATDLTNSHGEVNFIAIKSGSVDTSTMTEFFPENGRFIVGHSESGHHHVLERQGVTMKRGTDDRGFEILHAIVTEPVMLKQAAGAPHEPQIIGPNEYLITKNVERSPFTKQARRVAD
jgi:hypothetical protein